MSATERPAMRPALERPLRTLDDVVARVKAREAARAPQPADMQPRDGAVRWTVAQLARVLNWAPRSVQGRLRQLAGHRLAMRLPDGQWVATDSTAWPKPGAGLPLRLLVLLRGAPAAAVSHDAAPAVTSEPVAAPAAAPVPVRRLLEVLVPRSPSAAADDPVPAAAAVAWPTGGLRL